MANGPLTSLYKSNLQIWQKKALPLISDLIQGPYFCLSHPIIRRLKLVCFLILFISSYDYTEILMKYYFLLQTITKITLRIRDAIPCFAC